MKNLILFIVVSVSLFACKKRDLVLPKLQTSLDNGLVAHYSLDGNAFDSSIYGNHGFTSATPVHDRTNVPNKAMDFVRNEFQSSNIPINLKSSYTFSFWIKMNAYQDGMAVFEMTKGKVCNKNPQIWQWQNSIYLSTASDITNNIKIMSLQGIKVGIETPTWKHILWTVKNDTTSIYVGGKLIETKVMPWPDMTNVDLTLGTSGNHCTGDQGTSNYHNQPSKVSIDEVRIYNRVLNILEIQTLAK